MISNSLKLPCVLFVPSNNANYREMLSVADFLKDNGFARPLFFFERSSSIDINDDNHEYIGMSDFRKRIEKAIINFYCRVFFFNKKDEIKRKSLSYLLSFRIRKSLKVLKEKNPVSIVLRGDRHVGDGWEPSFIRAGVLLGIPTIVLAYSYTSYADSLLLRRRDKQELYADIYPEVKETFPAQCIYDEVSGKTILYKPAYVIKALNDNEMLPRYPWIMGGGNSTFMTAAGESMKKRLTSRGCKAEKVIITGLAAHDRLYENYNNRIILRKYIFDRYHLDFSKKLVVVSPLQLFEERICDLEKAKKEIKNLLDMCNRFDSNVIISLHPRMKRELYDDIFDKYEIPVAVERLFDIIPAADVFSAPYSSTVEWAILCSIPTVIFDFYNFNYPIYDGFPGIKIVKDKRQYVSEMNCIISNEKILLKKRNHQASSSKNLSPFDGKCLDRIADVLVKPEKYMNQKIAN